MYFLSVIQSWTIVWRRIWSRPINKNINANTTSLFKHFIKLLMQLFCKLQVAIWKLKIENCKYTSELSFNTDLIKLHIDSFLIKTDAMTTFCDNDLVLYHQKKQIFTPLKVIYKEIATLYWNRIKNCYKVCFMCLGPKLCGKIFRDVLFFFSTLFYGKKTRSV